MLNNLVPPSSPSRTLFDAAPNPEAERRKLRAMVAHVAHNGAKVRAAQRAAIEMLLGGAASITVDDVRGKLGELVDDSPKWIGAAFHTLRVAGLIVRDGFALSDRPAAHCRPVSRWTLRDRGAAEAWLAASG